MQQPSPVTTPGTEHRRRTKLPSDLATVLLLGLLLSGFSLWAGAGASDPGFRWASVGAGVVGLTVCAGLYRLKPWSRLAAGTGFAALCLFSAASTLLLGFTLLRILRVLLCAWCAAYLFSPSTARLFVVARPFRIDPAGIASLACISAPAIFLLWALPAAGLPVWASLLAMITYLAVYASVLEAPIDRRLSLLFAPRPTDLDDAAWRAFQAARAARLRGDRARARALLAPLPSGRSVDVLNDLLAMDDATAGGGLGRILYDADYEPPAADRPAVLESLRDTHPATLAERRARLIDGLLADAADPRSTFGVEMVATLERMTGLIFPSNEELRFREWWATARANGTGEQAALWLVARLWNAECPDAAEEVARLSEDPRLILATRLASVIEETTKRPPDVERILARKDATYLTLDIADEVGLYLLDSPVLKMDGPAAVADIVRQRTALVDFLVRFWEVYETDAGVEVPWILHCMVGAKVHLLRARARFARWWETERATFDRFDRAIVAGLRAAAEEDWEAAETAFTEAQATWPRRLCAGYNRAVSILKQERFADAERILLRLTAQRPKEALFWIRLGDCRRKQNRNTEALDAYREAAKLGNVGQDLAARLGVALAEQGKEEEATRTLDRALGPNPDADDLEEISTLLESAGAFSLAQKYRDAALEKNLEKGFDFGGEEEEADPRGPNGRFDGDGGPTASR